MFRPTALVVATFIVTATAAVGTAFHGSVENVFALAVEQAGANELNFERSVGGQGGGASVRRVFRHDLNLGSDIAGTDSLVGYIVIIGDSQIDPIHIAGFSSRQERF